MKNKTNLVPLNDQVIIERDAKDSVSPGGIHIPGDQEKPNRGTVVAVGPGSLEGERRSVMVLEPGHRVIFSKRAGHEVKEGDKEYVILRESDVLCVIQNPVGS